MLYGDLPAEQLATKGLYTNQATGREQPDRAHRLDQGPERDLQVRVRDVGSQRRVQVREGDRHRRGRRSAPTRSRWRALKPFAVLDEATLIGTPAGGRRARCSSRRSRNAGVPYVRHRARELRRPGPAVAAVLGARRRVHRQAAQGRQGRVTPARACRASRASSACSTRATSTSTSSRRSSRSTA